MLFANSDGAVAVGNVLYPSDDSDDSEYPGDIVAPESLMSADAVLTEDAGIDDKVVSSSASESSPTGDDKV